MIANWIFAVVFSALTFGCALMAACVKEEAPWPFHYMAIWWAIVAVPTLYWWIGDPA